MTIFFKRRFLQIIIFIAGFVPVLAGLGGMVYGTAFLNETVNAALDSHFRYLSGILFAIGLCFWSFVPKIEQKEREARILTILVFVGGATRLLAALIIGWPPVPMVLAIGMEVIITPLLYFGVRHVSKDI